MSSFTKESRDDDVFKIFKANLDEIWETNFLISSAPILSSYLSFLKETAFHVSSLVKCGKDEITLSVVI